ncbi:ammonium transporter [Chakrabartyella piscis]|uniref:ammonium transporter n=1 Tax=Chakrabartyella piscis TaxID=2918914 RepID=UPI0029587502|nr:ammonium transporter [Chakrabartyella piscis]
MYSSASTIWVLLGAALVFFMQAGFAILESGLTRAKNSGNIIMKNLMDLSIGAPIYWLTGFGIMFGSASGFFGGIDLFAQNDYSAILPAGVPMEAFLIFQTVFCATAATIVSGAMAERTKFSSYCIYSLLISAVVYPVSGHWIWGGGWLAEMGFHDFAGSTAVHMVGGVAALVGAKVLGPRIGKYGKDGKPKAILGHNLTMAALGVFILWFCWFGFNGCSTVGADGDEALLAMGSIFMTTNMSAAIAGVTVMIFTWIRYKKPDVSMTLNGTLAGLVGITAGCDAVSIGGSALIGFICGIVVVLSVEFIDQVLKVDDPVGAVGVHGVCGALGTILVGIFAIDGGLAYGGGFEYLKVQVIGVASVIVWVAITSAIIFLGIKHTVGLRVSEEEEILGLDIKEHNLVSSYADFAPTTSLENATTGLVSMNEAIPVENMSKEVPEATSDNGEGDFTKIVIITNQSKFDILKAALTDIGITGLTVTQVLGFGMQKGSTNYYRGIEVDVALRPKVKLEMVVCKIPVETVIAAAKKALYTGKVGDGKIFIYNVANVIKVRTGEEGYSALQDDDK